MRSRKVSEHGQLALRGAAVGLLAHLSLVGFFLLNNAGRIEYFVHFGTESPVISWARDILGDDVLVPHLDGHDGQFFWVQAHDPLLVNADSMSGLFDRPTYRTQRVAYPLVSSVWRLGGERALLWGLLTTNLMIVALGGYAASRIALTLGAPVRAGLAFALNPAVVVAVSYDTSDAMALAFLLLAVLAVGRHQLAWAAALGTVAVLTKESSLLALAGIAFFAPTIDHRSRAAVLIVPGAAAAGWFVYVHWRLGSSGVQLREFSAPFYGYYDAYRRGWYAIGNWEDAILAALLLPLAALTLGRFWGRPTLLLSAAVPYALMVPFLSADVLGLTNSSLRAFGPALTFLLLDYYGKRRSVRPPGTVGA
jgi:hypothetical protein